MSLNYSSEQTKIRLDQLISGTEEQARKYVTGILCYNANLEEALIDVTVFRELVPKSMVTDDATLGTPGMIPTVDAIKGYITAHGTTGPQGPQGVAGANGAQGAQGARGAQGATGATGPQGTAGAGVSILGEKSSVSQLPTTGNTGDAYLVGGNLYVWVGAGQGDSGTPSTAWKNVGNIQGPQGAQGATGPQGPTGQSGAPGSQGATGPQGSTGPQGQVGAQGPQGATGPKGSTGPQGQVGAQGPQGASGANITWAQLKTLLSNNGFTFDESAKTISCSGGFYQQ